MESITRRGFTNPLKIKAEDAAIALATNHTDAVLKAYSERKDTFGGRYVCADTFKELMPGFAESRESRTALNGAVHNAAAVLASEQFKRLVERGVQPGESRVVFVTGIPGAGKSTSVSDAFSNGAAVVFEGQLSRPETGMQKIQQALDKGFDVGIRAVHIEPEIALERTNFRFMDPSNGRGASLAVMSDIQGNLPSGLKQIQERFGDKVAVYVVDNTPGKEGRSIGWDSVAVLEREGNHEHIKQRLQTALDAGYHSGRYSADFYEQAAGRQPTRALDGGRFEKSSRSEYSQEQRPDFSGENQKLSTSLNQAEGLTQKTQLGSPALLQKIEQEMLAKGWPAPKVEEAITQLKTNAAQRPLVKPVVEPQKQKPRNPER